VGQRGADGRGQAEAGGLHLQRVGLDRGDQRGPVGVHVADRPGVGHRGHARQPADHRGRGGRQLGGVAEEVLPILHLQQVGAQPGDLRQQAGLGGGGEAQDGDDCRDADRDAQR
jgi:hypothetical protein